MKRHQAGLAEFGFPNRQNTLMQIDVLRAAVTTNTSVNVPCAPPSKTAALEGEKDYAEWRAIKALCARATLEVLGIIRDSALWRSACSVTLFLIPAASAASWNRRLSWRVVIGLPGLWPGNNQRSATGVVESKPRRRVFHHWRNRSSISGDSMTLRSLRPLDCSTRMIFCALSMCLTFSLTTSPARSPQP